MPAMRWDHRPEATKWTVTTITALKNRGPALLSTVPSDIDTLVPRL